MDTDTDTDTDKARFTFRFLGRQQGGAEDGWLLFRAPTWKTSNRRGIDAHAFVGDVQDWLLAQVDHRDRHAGNGEVEGLYPNLPQSFSTGSAFCVKLRRVADAMRFEEAFNVTGLEAILEAA